MLGCARRAILQDVLAAPLLWVLHEALVGAPLGLPAPFGQETGTLFLAQLRVTVASCLLDAEKPDILG